MRLNMDCLRDILLCVEENTGLRKSCYFVDSDLAVAQSYSDDEFETIPKYQVALLSSYSNDELIYHVHYCVYAELILPFDNSSDEKIMIADLTPKGHEFLGNIRNPDNWAKTKEVGGKIGAFGLNMAEKIAEGVATAYLKQVLGLS